MRDPRIAASPFRPVRTSPTRGRQTIVVSNQVPMPTGGGPHGVVRIMAGELSRDDTAPRPILVIEDRLVDWQDLLDLGIRRGNEPEISVGARVRRAFGQYRTLYRLMRDYRNVSVIQFEVPRASLILKLLYPRRVRLTVSEHSKGGLDAEATAVGASLITVAKVRLSTRLAFAVADRIVWPSQGAIEEFHVNHPRRERQARKYAVVHNGIQLNPRPETTVARSPTSPKRLVLVAADVADKNVDGLLSVLAEALSVQEKDTYVIDWIGGPPARHLPSRASLHVTMRGTIPPEAVRDALEGAHAFVALPHRTIFDIAVLEAMAAELPVICPPLTGFREALGEDYRFFATSAVDFRRALYALSNEGTRELTGGELRKRVDQYFTARAMVNSYLELESEVR